MGGLPQGSSWAAPGGAANAPSACSEFGPPTRNRFLDLGCGRSNCVLGRLPWGATACLRRIFSTDALNDT
eukprot:scaffold1_cov402-Prasinococcus_capsulatus_cf.AAC.25